MATVMRVNPVMRCAPVMQQRTNATSVRVMKAQAAKKLAGSSFTGGVQALRAPSAVVSNNVRRSLVVRAEEMDFDQMLAKGAEAVGSLLS